MVRMATMPRSFSFMRSAVKKDIAIPIGTPSMRKAVLYMKYQKYPSLATVAPVSGSRWKPRIST